MNPSHLRTAAASILFMLQLGSVRAHPPSGIVVDERGRVYFQDGAKGIWRIEQGAEPALLSPSAMHWLAIDPSGEFADSPQEFGEWFGRVTPKGQKPTLVWCSDFPCVIGQDGNLYSAYMHSLKIVRRTPEGNESVLVSPEKFGIDVSRQFGVTGIACGPDGTIYLVSLDDHPTTELGVYAVGMDGSIRTVAKNFVTEKIPESQRHDEIGPEYCRGMAVDRRGNVYVAVTGNRCVMKLPPEGKPSVVLKCEKPWTPTGVAEHNGAIYVLEYDDETPTEGRNWPPRVRKVTRDGSIKAIATIKR